MYQSNGRLGLTIEDDSNMTEVKTSKIKDAEEYMATVEAIRIFYDNADDSQI